MPHAKRAKKRHQRKAQPRAARKPLARTNAAPTKESKWFSRLGPLGIVLAPIVYSAIELRAEIEYTPHLNDSAMHSEMVRYAVGQLQAGHLPLDGWFPYLGLGSPLFLHYQSLGAMLAGLLGLVIGANQAFSLTLYLLVVAWPISVYLAGRLFGWSRWESAFAALVASFVVSATGIGYEQIAYLWKGFGVWSQAWAMWTLPLAWGLSWRAINEGRNYLAAALFIALTTAFHFETGYLAFIPVVLWILVKPSRFLERLRRAFVVGFGGFCLAAWAIVPLIVYRSWASINEFLQRSVDVRSYGWRQVTTWLFTGRILDYDRIPVITILAGIGFLACVVRWRRDLKSIALILVFLVSLVLFFGKATFGSLYNLLPGSKDIFTRRFIIGVQLGGVLLAGLGAVILARLLFSGARRVTKNGIDGWLAHRWRRIVARFLVAGLVIGATAPMWTEIASTDSADASLIARQRAATTAEKEVNQLVATTRAIGGGRVYAGMSFWGWGANFRVGLVPVSEYLSNDDVDEIGFTNRTASLMSDPEAYFNDANPADFALFGVRFLILPIGHKAPLGARLLQRAGPYQLWILPENSYIQVVDTYGPALVEDKTRMGADSASFVLSDLASRGLYPVVAYDGRQAATPTLASAKPPKGQAGKVLDETDNLVEGEASATVTANRTAVVLLKVSYDPGWTATVDGKTEPTEMIAPAYVGVRVGPGTHVVRFQYQALTYYPELFALALLTLAGLGLGPSIWRRRERSRRTDGTTARS
jgi:hypothetical protein